MNVYDKYIYLIFVIKIFYMLLSITHIHLNYKGDNNSYFHKNIIYWKDITEFIFITLMALLIIYLFNPIKNEIVMIDGETKTLFFTFGILLLITSKWSIFLHEAKWFKKLQLLLGDNSSSE